MSLAEKMGNIGAEISRARSAHERNDADRMDSALERFFELIDLTIAGENNTARVREIECLRDVARSIKGGSRNISIKSIEKYFLPFALLARKNKWKSPASSAPKSRHKF